MLETHGYWSVLCAVAQIRESRKQLRLTNFAPSGITGICHTQDFRAWGGLVTNGMWRDIALDRCRNGSVVLGGLCRAGTRTALLRSQTKSS